MSAIIETFLQCDKCYRSFGVDNRNANAKQQRVSAKNEGWTFKNRKDYCESCSKSKATTLLTDDVEKPEK